MPISNIPSSSPEPDDQIPGQTSFETTSQEKPAKRARRTKKQMIEDAVIPDDNAIIELKDSGTGAKIERPWTEAVKLIAQEKASFVDASLKYAVMKMAEQMTSPAQAAEPEQVQGEKRYVPGMSSHMVKRGTFTDDAGIQNVQISDIFGGHEATMIKSEWDALPFDKPSEDVVERETRYTIDGKALLKTGSEGSAGGDRLIHYSDAHGGLGEMFETEWELLSMSPPPRSGPVFPSNIPPKAEVGDEVVVGAETLSIGHDRFLAPSPISLDGEIIKPKRRWQRELGGGVNGKWESTVINADGGVQPKKVKQVEQPEPVETPVPVAAAQNGHSESVSQNGDGIAVVWREFMPNTFEKIGPGEWKVGSGLMDKIGLPSRGGEWSSLTVGPITASRTFSEDGEYTKVKIGEREEVVPVAGLRFMRMCRTLVEVEGNYMRGELASFLQTQNVTLAPLVSS
jgi:hypothetical protein